MDLSKDLISQFVKITNDSNKKETGSVSAYGTVVEQDGMMYVQLDGSAYLTPVDTSFVLHVNDRVIVDIKNHQAIVSANLTSPSVGNLELSDSQDTVLESIKDGYMTGITTIGKTGISVQHTECNGYTKIDKNGFAINDGRNDIIAFNSEDLEINCTNLLIQNGVQVESNISNKDDIESYEYDALTDICATPIYSYLEDGIKRIGIDIQDAPNDIIRANNIDLYQMVVILWKAVQQLNDKFNDTDVE